MPVPSKIFSELLPEDLAALEEFARDRRNTSEKCHEWLQAHGYTMSQSSVDRWKRKFDMTDKFRAAADLSRSMMSAAAEEAGTAKIADSGLLQVSQMIFDAGLDAQSNGTVAVKDLVNISAAWKNVITSKRHIEKLKQEIKEAIELAEKDVAKGASGEDVVNAIKKAMGI